MIVYKIPRKKRFIPASGLFSATFNVPTPAKYDFAGQTVVFYQKLLPNTVYLIDSFSLGGNIPAEDYLGAIDTVPQLTIQKTFDNEAIFERAIPLSGFFHDRQIVQFFKTGLDNVGIVASLTGVLNQTAELVGIAAVKLSINICFHAIDKSTWERMFNEKD